MKYTHKQVQDIERLNHFHINISVNDQILKSIEEFSSLNKMLVKLLLNEIQPHDIELLDELFDSYVMITQLTKILIPDDYMSLIYNKIVNAKLERELKRWELDDQQ